MASCLDLLPIIYMEYTWSVLFARSKVANLTPLQVPFLHCPAAEHRRHPTRLHNVTQFPTHPRRRSLRRAPTLRRCCESFVSISNGRGRCRKRSDVVVPRSCQRVVPMKTSGRIGAPHPTVGPLRRWAAARAGRTRSARGTLRGPNERLLVSKTEQTTPGIRWSPTQLLIGLSCV